MKTLLLTLILSLSSPVFATIYFSPVNVGVMNSLQSSGENSYKSSMTLGAEAFYFYKRLMMGLKFDHFAESEAPSVVTAKMKMDILAMQFGFRFLDAGISPYLFLGGGAFFQSVETRIFSQKENAASVVFGYKTGFGIMTQFAENWAGNFSVHYYPQSFISSFNYMLSVGYLF